MKIAFSGKIASGKSTTSLFISENIKKCEIVGFANRLKELTYELFNSDPNKKDRKLLQDFGLKIREVDPNAWVNALDKKIKDKENVIVDDLRFPNEFIYLKNKGFILIRLNISPEEQIKRIKLKYPENWEEHIQRINDKSETVLDNYNFDYNFCSDDTEKLNKIIKEKIKEI